MTDKTTDLLAEVTLSSPVKRGEQTIDLVKIREPRAGELRGLKMVEVAQLDVDSLMTLLPRVTLPQLHATEIEQMPPADFFALATEIANFLVPEGLRPEFPQT